MPLEFHYHDNKVDGERRTAQRAALLIYNKTAVLASC
jgi:hypothetical protein